MNSQTVGIIERFTRAGWLVSIEPFIVVAFTHYHISISRNTGVPSKPDPTVLSGEGKTIDEAMEAPRAKVQMFLELWGISL
jgi:hypothetical protein